MYSILGKAQGDRILLLHKSDEQKEGGGEFGEVHSKYKDSNVREQPKRDKDIWDHSGGRESLHHNGTLSRWRSLPQPSVDKEEWEGEINFEGDYTGTKIPTQQPNSAPGSQTLECAALFRHEQDK